MRRRPIQITIAPTRPDCSRPHCRRRTGKASPSGSAKRSAAASCAASGWRCFSNRPAAWARNRSRSALRSGGKLAMYSNAGPSGQGHETVFPAIVADVLGIPADRIELRYNDVAAPKSSAPVRSVRARWSVTAPRCRQPPRRSSRRAGSSRRANLKSRWRTSSSKPANTRSPAPISMVTLQSLIERKWSEPNHPLDTNTTIDLATAFPSGAHIAEVARAFRARQSASADSRRRRPARLFLRHRPALGQSALSLGRARRARRKRNSIRLVDRPHSPRLPALRHRSSRSLPRLRSLLGHSGRRGDRH